MTLDEMRKLINDMDPSLERGSAAYRAALTLLASTEVGTDIGNIVQFTGLPQSTVSGFSIELERNGVWKDGMVHHSGWDDEESGETGFWLDVSIAMGYITRIKPAMALSVNGP